MRTNVYIEPFNLYYGCLKGSPYKWLNLRHLCEHEYPGIDINRIRVFAADVKPRPSNPDVHLRQKLYFTALETIEGLTLHRGLYQVRQRWVPLVNPVPVPVNPVNAGYNVIPAASQTTVPVGTPAFTLLPDGTQLALVTHTEEKGSDVNLASYLLADAFKDDMDEAIVVTNDFDLAEAVRLTVLEAKKPVHVLHPCHSSSGSGPNKKLAQASSTSKRISIKALEACQFPETLVTTKGAKLIRPISW